MVSFERVFEVLDAPEPITDKPSAIDLVDPAGRVEFDDVTFRYPAANESSIASMETQAIPGADPDHDVLVASLAARSPPARRWRSSVRRAPARARWRRSSRGCTT